MKTTILPQSVCCRQIEVEYDENRVITGVTFIGGCQGNTTGLSKLLVGYTIDEVIKRLEGIKCRGSRTGETSCPDQLAQGLKNI